MAAQCARAPPHGAALFVVGEMFCNWWHEAIRSNGQTGFCSCALRMYTVIQFFFNVVRSTRVSYVRLSLQHFASERIVFEPLLLMFGAWHGESSFLFRRAGAVFVFCGKTVQDRRGILCTVDCFAVGEGVSMHGIHGWAQEKIAVGGGVSMNGVHG